MLLQANQGVSGKQTGQNITVGVGEYSDVLVTELQAHYYQQAYRGGTYFTSIAAAAGTAYTGASGGTPLVGVYNPSNSGVNLVLKTASVSVVAAASVAGQTQFRVYGGSTVAPTGTLVAPYSCLTLSQTGSKAKAINNAAMTSASALNYITTIGTYYWASAASAFLAAPLIWDAAGQIIVQPGNALCLGAVTIPTSMTNDATLVWDEVPV